MTEKTEIDAAHAAMEAAPDDGAARLSFYERLADTEVFVLLQSEPRGETIEPATFEVEDQTYVLVFDRIERLSRFAEGEAPYAGLSGRGLVEMLAGQGIGIGLNLDVAPSAMLLPAEAIDWLRETLGSGPSQISARLEEVLPPGDLPEKLLTGLDRKLAASAGLAELAYLVRARLAKGGETHLLVFVDTIEDAEAALSRAVNEALTFSTIEAGQLDVLHVRSNDALAARVARVGLRFDLPKPEAPATPGANPGMDPDRPPKLR